MGAGGVRLARVGRASHHGPLGQSRWPGSFYTGTSRAMSPQCLALVNPLSRAGGASIGQGIPTIKSRLEMERLGDLADTHAAAQRVRGRTFEGGLARFVARVGGTTAAAVAEAEASALLEAPPPAGDAAAAAQARLATLRHARACVEQWRQDAPPPP
jgi:hypothetical protein